MIYRSRRLARPAPDSYAPKRSPDGVTLGEASRAKLTAAGADVDQVEAALHGMRRGDRNCLLGSCRMPGAASYAET